MARSTRSSRPRWEMISRSDRLKGGMLGLRVFDIGIQTGHALSSLRDGVPAAQAGPDGERDNGNGSLMRVLPLALWHRGSDAELARDACEQSKVTHGHLRAQLCCALYCLWVRRTLQGGTSPRAGAATSGWSRPPSAWATTPTPPPRWRAAGIPRNPAQPLHQPSRRP